MKKFIRFICFFLVVVIMFGGLNFFFSTNSDRDGVHIRGYFKEPQNSIDVLMVGASELYSGFNSPLAWGKYHFTSYAISISGMPGSLYQIITEKALETQNPKLVVFEINGFLFNDRYYEHRKPIHAWFDNVGINDSGKEFIENNIPAKKRLEYYLPFYKYHSNWRHPGICTKNALNRLCLEKEGISYSKAFANSNLTRKTTELKRKDAFFTEKSKEYMTQLLMFCKDRKLKNVLFFRAPHCVKNENPQAISEIESLIKSYGYDFVDYENTYDEIGLDVKADFYNSEHLNIYGMEKFTNLFGKYIVDKYDIKTNYSEETVELWNRCVTAMDKTIEECKKDKDHSTYYELTTYENAKGKKHSRFSRIKCETKEKHETK